MRFLGTALRALVVVLLVGLGLVGVPGAVQADDQPNGQVFTGTVRSVSGEPIAGARVTINVSYCGETAASCGYGDATTSDASGGFAIDMRDVWTATPTQIIVQAEGYRTFTSPLSSWSADVVMEAGDSGPDQATVTVEVTYPDGAPAAGVDIYLGDYDYAGPFFPEEPEAATGPDGRHVFTFAVPMGRWDVAVVGGQWHQTFCCLAPGANAVQRFTVPRAGAVASGTLRDASAAPIPNARLTAVGRYATRFFDTDAHGQYSVDLPQGAYTVRVLTGLPSDVAELTVDDTEPISLDLQVPTPVIVRGTVRDSAGTPVPDVDLYPLFKSGAGSLPHTTTDAYGAYRVELAPGTYRLRLYGPDGSQHDQELAVAAPGPDDHDITLLGFTMPEPEPEPEPEPAPVPSVVEAYALHSDVARVIFRSAVAEAGTGVFVRAQCADGAGFVRDVRATTLDRRIRLGGLAPETAYRCRVKEQVDGVWTAWSTYSPWFRTPELAPPGPPSDIEVDVLSPRRVEVSFRRPTTGDAVEKFMVWCVHADEVVSRTHGTRRRYTIRDLEPGTRYYCSVQARNAAGRSGWLQSRVFRTPVVYASDGAASR